MSIFLAVALIFTSLLLFLAINLCLKKTNYVLNQHVDTFKFNGITDNFELVNLGSTQPKFGFDYSEFALKSMNWAVGSQTFEYDFKILKQYHSNLKINAVVLMPICPFSFFFHQNDDVSASYKYYSFLNPKLINDFSRITKFLYVDYPLFTVRRNFIRLIKDVPKDNRFDIAFNPLTKREIMEDAKSWIESWKNQFYLEDLAAIQPSEENMESIRKNIEVLKEMTSFCLQHSYKPVFLIMPVTAVLGSFFPVTFINKYVIDNVRKSNVDNIPFLNYWGDRRFLSSDLYFNSFFLNIQGRSKFTQLVIEDLSKINYL